MGIIAASGKMPLLILDEVKKRGHIAVVAGIKGEVESGIKDKADIFKDFSLGDVQSFISFFNENRVKEIIIAGKIDQRVVFSMDSFKATSKNLLKSTPDKRPASIIHSVFSFLEKMGLKIIDPSPYLKPCFCREGILTEGEMSLETEEDLDFGMKIARKIADLDIGQTVVIKNKIIIALEGIDGTNETIKRGGQLAGKGTVVVKVSRSAQDPRIDLPVIGLDTVRSCIKAGSRILCFEAGAIPFFQKEKSVSLAKKNGLLIVAKNI